ncbi:MAG: HEAT repeat domain-containing protein [Candidatus Riflebacteria bacterium]|nr:HEAT repeat domain-containing protein [Candidatus Riflebacteria bacterium]
MSENFPLILETALTKPDSFIQEILPELEPLTEDKLKALTSVLESGTVIDKQNVTKLFVENLKENGAAYLTNALDVKRPKLFIPIANIIGELRYSKALDALKAALKKEYSELVLAAIKAISLMPSSKPVVDTLATFYLTFEDEVLLSKSIKYLAAYSKELVPIFLEKYAKLKSERQMWLLDYFSFVADERSEKLLIEEYTKYPDEKGVYCIDGLGRIGTDEAVAALSKALETPEWFLRKHIVTALGVSNNVNAIPPLLKALDDSHVLVRGAAVKSLSQVGNKNPDLLINALKTAQKQMKSNLVRAMGLLKNEKFVEPLTEVLKDRNSLFYAIDAVGDLGFPQAEFALRRLLKDDVWFNRLNALEALAKLNSRELKTFAQEAAEDENDMVRNSAARILVALKTKQLQ